MSKSQTRSTTSPNPGWGLAQQRQAPTHPGEMFRLEYREACEPTLSLSDAARRMGMSINRLSEIELGKRGVTAETAVLFGALTGTSPEMWATLQMRYDVWHAMRTVDVSKVTPAGGTDAPVHSAKPARGSVEPVQRARRGGRVAKAGADPAAAR